MDLRSQRGGSTSSSVSFENGGQQRRDGFPLLLRFGAFQFPFERRLFAALAFVALWVQVITESRRLAAVTRFKLTVLPGYHIGSNDPNSVIVELSLLNDACQWQSRTTYLPSFGQ